VSAQVRTVDILPTVLAELGLEAADGIDGRSLTPFLDGEASAEERAAYIETPHFADPRGWKRAVRYRGWKLIERLESGERQLYDLGADPEEKVDVHAERGDIATELARHFEVRAAAPQVTVESPASVRERLRALGYGE
jgi:arylsulfatase A-like enzyme